MMKMEFSSSETSVSISHISEDSNDNPSSFIKCSFLHFAVNLLKRFILEASYCGEVSGEFNLLKSPGILHLFTSLLK
jgi:hypothetical protein